MANIAKGVNIVLRWLCASVCVLGLVPPTLANTFVYISLASERKIQVFRLDPRDGTLSAVDAVTLESGPTALCVDPRQKHLYASLRGAGELASFAINPATGKLKLLNKVSIGKNDGAVALAVDRSGRWLASASYGSGKIMTHAIKEDGSLKAPAADTVETARSAHFITSDSQGRFLFVPHVGPNAVYQFWLDPETGKLTSAGKVGGGMGKGPRHLAFHPRLPMAFSSNEKGNSITAWRFDPETGLKAGEILSTLPTGFTGMNSTADVKVHPSGKFVWVSNRGHDSLAGFAIDERGKLSPLGHTPTEKVPRSFEVDPDGRYLFSAGENSGRLAVYRIDLDTGKLTPIENYRVGRKLSWVMAVKLDKK